MIDDLSSISEEERCLFRPFTRESLVVIQGRIAEEQRKIKELERRRAEGEVANRISILHHYNQFLSRWFYFILIFFHNILKWLLFILYMCVSLNVLSLSSFTQTPSKKNQFQWKPTKRKQLNKIYVSICLSVCLSLSVSISVCKTYYLYI